MFKVTAAELMAYHERYVAKWGGKAVELEFDELYIDKGGVHEEAEEAQEAQEVQEAQEGVHEDLHQDLHDSTTASHPLQIDLNNVILDPTIYGTLLIHIRRLISSSGHYTGKSFFKRLKSLELIRCLFTNIYMAVMGGILGGNGGRESSWAGTTAMVIAYKSLKTVPFKSVPLLA